MGIFSRKVNKEGDGTSIEQWKKDNRDQLIFRKGEQFFGTTLQITNKGNGIFKISISKVEDLNKPVNSTSYYVLADDSIKDLSESQIDSFINDIEACYRAYVKECYVKECKDKFYYLNLSVPVCEYHDGIVEDTSRSKDMRNNMIEEEEAQKKAKAEADSNARKTEKKNRMIDFEKAHPIVGKMEEGKVYLVDNKFVGKRDNVYFCVFPKYAGNERAQRRVDVFENLDSLLEIISLPGVSDEWIAKGEVVGDVEDGAEVMVNEKILKLIEKEIENQSYERS